MALGVGVLCVITAIGLGIALSHSYKQCAELYEKWKEILAENHELKTLIDERQETVDKLQCRLEERTDQQNKIDDLELQIAESQTDTQLKQEVETLENQVEDLEETLEETIGENKQLMESVVKLKKIISSINKLTEDSPVTGPLVPG